MHVLQSLQADDSRIQNGQLLSQLNQYFADFHCLVERTPFQEKP
jgi:hypothetical protein